MRQILRFSLFFALSETDLLHDRRKRLSYDRNDLARDECRKDRALSDTDSRITEGDQVKEYDRKNHAEQDNCAVHDSLDFCEGLTSFLGDSHCHALHGHRNEIHIQIQEDAECYEHNTHALHSQTSDVPSGKEEISYHPFREVDKISKDRGKDDLEQVDRIELFTQKQDLHKDIEAEYDRNAGSGLHFYDITDDIRERVDG